MNQTFIEPTDPRVEPPFPQQPPLPVPIWLLSHRAVRTSRRVRAIFDLVSAQSSTRTR